MDALIHGHNTKRVFANAVYNEMIRDKNHIHMNSTRWGSLASFVQYLSATGKCEIDETDRGWYIRYIDPEGRVRDEEQRLRDETKARMEERSRRQLAEVHRVELERQAERDAERREDDDAAAGVGELTGSLAPSALQAKRPKLSAAPALFQSAVAAAPPPEAPAVLPPTWAPAASTWLEPGIVVQINSSKVGDGTLKTHKGVVVAVQGRACEVLMFHTGHSVHDVDDKRLDTVLGPVGGKVRVLAGPMKGRDGTLESVDAHSMLVGVRMATGELLKLAVEQVAKVFE